MDNENLKVGCTIVARFAPLTSKRSIQDEKKCYFEGSTTGKRVKKSEVLPPLLLRTNIINWSVLLNKGAGAIPGKSLVVLGSVHEFPPYDPSHPHVSTARLLGEKKQSRACLTNKSASGKIRELISRINLSFI